jgi:hypothetical protein
MSAKADFTLPIERVSMVAQRSTSHMGFQRWREALLRDDDKTQPAKPLSLRGLARKGPEAPAGLSCRPRGRSSAEDGEKERAAR